MQDGSELAQVYTSLHQELLSSREQLKTAEVYKCSSHCVFDKIYSQREKWDIEDERDIWNNEIQAEKENNQKLEVSNIII